MIMAGIHSMDMMPIMTTEDTEMVAVVEVVVDTGEAMYDILIPHFSIFCFLFFVVYKESLHSVISIIIPMDLSITEFDH